MSRKIVFVVSLLVLVFFAFSPNAFANSHEGKYDYIYKNPPKQRLGAYGVYVFLNKKTRYTHSPSKLKGAKHAARINAYNYEAYN